MIDPIGDRMKSLENAHRRTLNPGKYILLRIDGKAFHTYTRGMRRPYDGKLIEAMDHTARTLAEEIQGCRAAYAQSDEISLLLTSWVDPNAPAIKRQLWCGGVEAKLVSVSASIATAAFNRVTPNVGRTALFDSRVWEISNPSDVMDYFSWRRADCVRNSVTMAASAYFSHKDLHKTSAKKEMLREIGDPWDALEDSFKYGRLFTKERRLDLVSYTHSKTGECSTIEAERSYWRSTPYQYDALIKPHIPDPLT